MVRLTSLDFDGLDGLCQNLSRPITCSPYATAGHGFEMRAGRFRIVSVIMAGGMVAGGPPRTSVRSSIHPGAKPGQ